MKSYFSHFLRNAAVTTPFESIDNDSEDIATRNLDLREWLYYKKPK